MERSCKFMNVRLKNDFSNSLEELKIFFSAQAECTAVVDQLTGAQSQNPTQETAHLHIQARKHVRTHARTHNGEQHFWIPKSFDRA